MKNYNSELEQLQVKIQRKSKLEVMIKNLSTERISLQKKERSLATVRQKEQADVDKLSGGSLSSLFYAVLGKKQERLEREQLEAYAAAVKHDSVCAQLESITKDIENYQNELSEICNSEKLYKNLMHEKAESVKLSNSVIGSEICGIEEHLHYINAQLKEIDEAYSVGKSAESQVNEIISSLNSAEGWGTWDLLGGGWLTDMAKHSHLDDAQQKINQLQVQLRRYRTELLDIQIQSDVQAKVESFLGFADFFFDGLFTDWMVLDHIRNAQGQIESTYSHIKQVQSRLLAIKNDLLAQQQELQNKLEALILKS